jgi:RNA polymerase-associated protein LEO1
MVPCICSAQSAAPSHTSERLPSPEREHRKAMEYAEEDDPSADQGGQLEANVQIPNVPTPRSSDGQVCLLH